MATVIDELTVLLSLDASKFKTGADEAVLQSSKVKDETTKHAKEMSGALGGGSGGGGGLAEALISVTTKVLSFFAAIATGVKVAEFAAQVTSAGVALGIMSDTLGMTPERISSIQMAVERLTGSSDDVYPSLKKLNDLVVNFKTWGGLSGMSSMPQWVSLLGINLRKVENGEDFMEKIVAAMNRKGWDQQQQIQFLTTQAGIGAGLARLYTRPGGTTTARADIQAASVDEFTKKQVKDAEALNAAWVNASQSVEALGRKLLEKVDPYLTKFLNRTADFTQLPWHEVGDNLKKSHATYRPEVLADHFKVLQEKLSSIFAPITNFFKAIASAISSASPAVEGFGATLLAGAAGWARIITDKVLGAITAMEKAWEKFEHDHAHAFEVLGQAALDASDAAATEAGIVPPGGADADKATGTQQTLDDLRRKGLPILSGGTPVSEGNPMPVKVIGQVQTAPNVNADSSSGSAAGGDGSAAPAPGSTPKSPAAAPADDPWWKKAWTTVKTAVVGPSAPAASGAPAAPGTVLPTPAAPAPQASPAPAHPFTPTPTSPTAPAANPPGEWFHAGGISVPLPAGSQERAFKFTPVGQDNDRAPAGTAPSPVAAPAQPRAPLQLMGATPPSPVGAVQPANTYFGRPDLRHLPSKSIRYRAGQDQQQSYLGGSRVAAEGFAAGMKKAVTANSNHVNIGGVSFTAETTPSKGNDIQARLRRNTFALRSDVGLA